MNEQQSPARRGHVPARTCIGCRRVCPAGELVRLGLSSGPPASLVVVSSGERPPGRGAWLHPSEACVKAAIKAGALGRAFRASVPPIDAAVLTASILASR